MFNVYDIGTLHDSISDLRLTRYREILVPISVYPDIGPDIGYPDIGTYLDIGNPDIGENVRLVAPPRKLLLLRQRALDAWDTVAAGLGKT